MKDLRKIQEFFSKPVEDKIDTITMDVPLFLRTLEYAREDAKDDMDLHDVTEKAIKGTKQKGILSMVDYDDLTKQKIKEAIQQVISEEKTKRDRCLRIADRKFDKPSAYKSGAVVRCRKGKIWKNLKEVGDAGSKIYPYSKVKELYWKTEYEFTTDSGTEYIVKFDIGRFEIGIDMANVVFFTKESMELARRGEIPTVFLSSTNKGEMFSVMATITQIVKEFLDKNEAIERLVISPSKESDEDDRRFKLYMAYINKQLDPSKFDVEISNRGTYKDIEITRKNTNSENLKEDESLNKWFKRQGPSGKEGGWVDCNTCRTIDGKTKCKACGRKKGEKRSKYPSCRPTPAKCKTKGKGKTWGKTK